MIPLWFAVRECLGNCTPALLATKVMVPVTGPAWENVGVLGSPPFAIPRSAPS